MWTESTRPGIPLQEGRYTRLPDALLSVLTPREHQLVHLLLSYRWTDDALIYPSVRTMARRLRCSERTIQRTIRSLERQGYIVVMARYRDDEQTDQASNVYQPGPALLPLLADVPISRERDERPPRVTRVAGKRDPGNRYTPTRRPEQRTQPPAGASKYLGGPLAAYIRT